MDARDSAERFIEVFSRIFFRFQRRKAPDAYRPTRETLAVLLHLSTTGPITVTEAMAHFDRSQAAMSEIFARIERQGLIARIADRRDRRRTLVWLTDEGRAVLKEETEALSVPLLTEAMEHLAPNERRTLLDGLSALLETPTDGRKEEQ